MRSAKGFTLIELMIVLSVVGIVIAAVFGACGGCDYNYSGENHAKATSEAKAYAKQATDAGAEVKFLSCVDHDTGTQDGYLACNFLIEGKPVTLDCAGKSVFQDNHGCKAYMPKMNVNQY